MISFGIILIVLIVQTYFHPFGNWDAWMIWNVKAKHLAFKGTDYFFKESYKHLTHPGYPLLLPSIIARGLRFHGTNSLVIPGFISISYFVILSGIVFSFVFNHTRNLFLAIAGIFALIITPHVVLETIGQYADIPLACYIALATCLIVYNFKQTNNLIYIISGLCFGYAILMKNEGLLFFTICLIASVIFLLLRRIKLSSILLIVMGASLGLLLLLDLKNSLPREDHLAGIVWDMKTLINQMEYNAPLILKYYLKNLVKFSEFFLLIALMLIIKKYRFSFKGTLSYYLLIILGMIAGYTSIYLIVSNPDFLLSTSSKRLFLHFYPLVIIYFFTSLISFEHRNKSLK